jgi:hypothetical protein
MEKHEDIIKELQDLRFMIVRIDNAIVGDEARGHVGLVKRVSDVEIMVDKNAGAIKKLTTEQKLRNAKVAGLAAGITLGAQGLWDYLKDIFHH